MSDKSLDKIETRIDKIEEISGKKKDSTKSKAFLGVENRIK